MRKYCAFRDQGAKVPPGRWQWRDKKSPPSEKILCVQRPGSVGLRKYPQFCTIAYYCREGGSKKTGEKVSLVRESSGHNEKLPCVLRPGSVGVRKYPQFCGIPRWLRREKTLHHSREHCADRGRGLLVCEGFQSSVRSRIVMIVKVAMAGENGRTNHHRMRKYCAYRGPGFSVCEYHPQFRTVVICMK